MGSCGRSFANNLLEKVPGLKGRFTYGSLRLIDASNVVRARWSGLAQRAGRFPKRAAVPQRPFGS
jgi:hypothetical protein